MSYSLIIRLQSVQLGKTNNWLEFRGFIPQHDINKEYTFEFCYTELHTNAYLSEKQKKQLREILTDNFGYPPFNNNIEEIQNKLSEEMYSRIELE
ncbi:hypothetical protein [Streptococcus infantarius]|uniref:hypothetical protein n=1 Tax=Streptococcus infantarius TaxID=102684 RepID=UPI0022E38D08|nr:hypothetical protein [Streptococcus infantarius]